MQDAGVHVYDNVYNNYTIGISRTYIRPVCYI